MPVCSLFEIADDGFQNIGDYSVFKSSIKYLDFSTDNYFFQTEDNLGEVKLFEIQQGQEVLPTAIDFGLEWLGEGLRQYGPLTKVRKQYSADNRIMQICKLSGKPILAIGDEVGTIRLFTFPGTSDEYYQCYGDHVYNITKCLFTHDARFFVSTSTYDRCIFKWRVAYNQGTIRRHLQEQIAANNEVPIPADTREGGAEAQPDMQIEEA